MSDAGDRIRQARKERGWSQADLARQVGVSQPAIRKVEKGETLKSRYLPKIAKVLNLPLDELDKDLNIQPVGEGLILQKTSLLGERDLPVYASAEGEEGQLIVTFDPVDRTQRPAPLFSVKGAYGLIITGESMEPELEAGDIALIHPHLPPSAGKTYIFYSEKPTGDVTAKVKRLVRITADYWLVRQWNPPDGEEAVFQLARTDWPVCHRVIGKYSA